MGLRLLCEPEKSHCRSDNRLKIAFSVGFTSLGLNRHDGSFFIGSPGVITEVVIIIVQTGKQTGCCLRKYCSAEKEFSIFGPTCLLSEFDDSRERFYRRARLHFN